MELYDRALEVRQKTVEDDNPSVADTYHSIGMVLKQQGKFDEAMEILPEVAEADEGDEGQSRRGKLCRCQGIPEHGIGASEKRKFGESAASYQRSLEISKKTIGEEHSSMAKTYQNLAEVLQEQGKLDDAMKL